MHYRFHKWLDQDDTRRFLFLMVIVITGGWAPILWDNWIVKLGGMSWMLLWAISRWYYLHGGSLWKSN